MTPDQDELGRFKAAEAEDPIPALRARLAGLTPDQQAYIVSRVAREREARRTLWQCSNPLCLGTPHREAPGPHARAHQRWPFKANDGHWGCLWMAGRGWGKTRAVAEAVRYAVTVLGYRRIGLIGRTAGDVRDVLVEGESGILNVFPSWERPEYVASKAQVEFKNGALAYMLSAEKPDAIRGKQFDLVIFDEFSSFPKADEVLSNALFALRLKTGRHGPRALFATTPKPNKAMKALVRREGLKLVTGRTADNLRNLASTFKDAVMSHYEGTRTGRQELDGELLGDVEGALLSYEIFDREGFRCEAAEMPPLKRIVVAVDPAVTSSTKSDHTGVSVVGLGENGHSYVLGSWALKSSPAECMQFAIRQYHQWGANTVVAEVNNGGDYVGTVLRQLDPTVAFETVRAAVGKTARAEPVAMLYEQGRVHHVGAPSQYAALETQWASWLPTDEDSPDELDSVVWAVTKLVLDQGNSYDSWNSIPKAVRRR